MSRSNRARSKSSPETTIRSAPTSTYWRAAPHLFPSCWVPLLTKKRYAIFPRSVGFPFIEYGPMQLYLDQGYAYVAMDVPGTVRSTGTWDRVSRAEGEAIHDVIEHIATLDWAGRIGMIEMSYYCWSQWNAARTRPPHLATIVAFDGATDMYRDWMYQGGIPIQGFLNTWLYGSVLLQHHGNRLPIVDNGRGDFINDIYQHPFDDEWQRRRSPFWELDHVDIPSTPACQRGTKLCHWPCSATARTRKQCSGGSPRHPPTKPTSTRYGPSIPTAGTCLRGFGRPAGPHDPRRAKPAGRLTPVGIDRLTDAHRCES
jgi:X-Pro dipeptidyl-peptidase (S15 family)